MVTDSNTLMHFAELCRPLAGGGDSLVVALFLGGLVGSATHCAVMCSPFVMAQVPDASQNLRQRLLLPYHLGRITTYALLGAIAATAFGALVSGEAFYLISRLMLAMAGCSFIAAMFFRLPVRLPRLFGKMSSCAVAQMHQLAQTPYIFKRFTLGLTMGLIPCGLVFAALMAAAASGSALTGAAAMAAFGVGTTPALMLIGVGKSFLLKKHPRFWYHTNTAILGASGILLLSLARS